MARKVSIQYPGVARCEANLRARRTDALRKVELALVLRSKTTMSLAGIEESLKIGSRGVRRIGNVTIALTG